MIMKKQLLLLLTASTTLYGASHIDDEVHVVKVRHVNSNGIQGAYIFRNVKGKEDLAARVTIIQESAPDLTWKLHYTRGNEIAYLVSYKK